MRAGKIDLYRLISNRTKYGAAAENELRELQHNEKNSTMV